MAALKTTFPKPTITPKPQSDLLKSYNDYSAGRTGLTQDELISSYAASYNLTQVQTSQLEKEIKSQEEQAKKTTETKPKTPSPEAKPSTKEGLVITRTPYPKWWNDSLTAAINLQGPGSQTLATVSGDLRLYVATIVLTVTGETQITIRFGKYGSSGPIFLGGEGQPMGLVAAMGNSPAPCGVGDLTIEATGDPGNPVSIGGFATCFVEQKKP